MAPRKIIFLNFLVLKLKLEIALGLLVPPTRIFLFPKRYKTTKYLPTFEIFSPHW